MRRQPHFRREMFLFRTGQGGLRTAREVRAGKWYDVFGSTVIGQIAGRLAYVARASPAAGPLLAGFGVATARKSPQ